MTKSTGIRTSNFQCYSRECALQQLNALAGFLLFSWPAAPQHAEKYDVLRYLVLPQTEKTGSLAQEGDRSTQSFVRHGYHETQDLIREGGLEIQQGQARLSQQVPSLADTFEAECITFNAMFWQLQDSGKEREEQSEMYSQTKGHNLGESLGGLPSYSWTK